MIRPLVRAALLMAITAIASVRAAPLEILVEDAADPYSRPDGTGYANDVVKAAFAAENVDIKLTVVPYSRCKAQVLKGDAVACFNMGADPANDGLVALADKPIFTVRPVYFQSLNRPIAAGNEAEIGKGLTIGVVNEYEYPPAVLRARDRGAIFVKSPSEQVSLKHLAAGDLNLALVMTNDLKGEAYWISNAGVAGRVAVAFASADVQIGTIGFSTRNSLGAWAREKFNAGFRQISADGTIERINARWNTWLDGRQ